MAWHSSRSDRVADLDRLLHDLEERLSRLSRNAARASMSAPHTVGRISDAVAAALADVTHRFRGRARAAGEEAGHLSDDALNFSNDALRKLTREVEHRPLLALAIAAGIGALTVMIFARRD